MIKAEKIEFYNSVAQKRSQWREKGAYYHEELENYLRFLIPPDSSVIEIGCGTGETLAAVNPAKGLGVDISPKMVEIAREKYPHLQFEVGDIEALDIEEKFDYVLVDGTIGTVDDIQLAFGELHKVCKPETHLIIVYYNYLWEPALKLAEMLGMRMKHLLQHWLPLEDISNLLYLNDFEVVKKGYHCLMPVNIPGLSTFLNKFVSNMPFFWNFL